MALIEISETQLAFGYLHSFLNVYKPRHFIVPSIRQEGGMGSFAFPGADIIINENHLIQFKRPFYFKTNGIKEFWRYEKPKNIFPPYFRFYIKNNDPTNQLSKLVRATKEGLSAEYVSPLFAHETQFFRLIKNDRELLNGYVHIDILQFSSLMRVIGNNNEHTIIYNQGSVDNNICFCFSESKELTAERFNPNSEIRRTGRNFTPTEIISRISSIFFNQEDLPVSDQNTLEQCQFLQEKLFIERDIVWSFNYEINK